MVRIDWDAPASPASGGPLGPGIYLVRVTGCQLKHSRKSGEPYFNPSLAAVHYNDAPLGYDVLMLGGGGAGVGKAKLKALGFTKADVDISASDLIGRRVWAAFVADTYDGKARLKVDGKAKGSAGGYWPEPAQPDGASVPADADPLSDPDPIPF